MARHWLACGAFMERSVTRSGRSRRRGRSTHWIRKKRRRSSAPRRRALAQPAWLSFSVLDQSRMIGAGAASSMWEPWDTNGVIRRLDVAMIGALLLLLGGSAFAQTTFGLLEGRITDASGGALPGATITVTQPTTGFVRTVVADVLGLYRVQYLNPSHYDVTVERSGFAKVTYQSVKIDIGQAVAFNVRMEVDQVAVVMDVTPMATVTP